MAKALTEAEQLRANAERVLRGLERMKRWVDIGKLRFRGLGEFDTRRAVISLAHRRAVELDGTLVRAVVRPRARRS